MRFFALVWLIFLVGCGYQPISYYTSSAFGKSVYVEIKIHPDFPRAGVSLKNELNHALLARLHLELASKEEAQSVIEAEVSNLKFDMIAQDAQGFANHYRANVQVTLTYKDLDEQEYKMVLGASSDYAASETMTSVAIEKAQLEAINSALRSIVDQFVSKIFYQGALFQRRKQQ
ncbi:LPS assembly lipoprotein LptE [Helicobacter pametensis]|uniref:LPS assembly lipoprotein LptE n=1 Tax=Helicobacter pametensis TaxID=95149 RepID=UPI0004887F92|nr:LPS assembly lipoprotein LptE [Helicobacter pametensis]